MRPVRTKFLKLFLPAEYRRNARKDAADRRQDRADRPDVFAFRQPADLHTRVLGAEHDRKDDHEHGGQHGEDARKSGDRAQNPEFQELDEDEKRRAEDSKGARPGPRTFRRKP